MDHMRRRINGLAKFGKSEYISCRSYPLEGRIRIVQLRGMGMRWTGRAVRDCFARTSGVSLTAKSRGPGAPVLALSLRQCLRIAPMTGARQPIPEEIAYKR